jgi:hypothetical protein
MSEGTRDATTVTTLTWTVTFLTNLLPSLNPGSQRPSLWWTGSRVIPLCSQPTYMEVIPNLPHFSMFLKIVCWPATNILSHFGGQLYNLSNILYSHWIFTLSPPQGHWWSTTHMMMTSRDVRSTASVLMTRSLNKWPEPTLRSVDFNTQFWSLYQSI